MQIMRNLNIFLALLFLACALAVCGVGLGNVVINEVELSPPDNGTKWVELYNNGDETVDLTGWIVKIIDGPWTGPIAISGMIGPKDFLVAEGEPRWSVISNGTVILYDGAGNVVDQTHGLSDAESNDFTWARMPDGKDTDTKGDFAFFLGSKGRSNGGAVLGRR